MLRDIATQRQSVETYVGSVQRDLAELHLDRRALALKEDQLQEDRKTFDIEKSAFENGKTAFEMMTKRDLTQSAARNPEINLSPQSQNMSNKARRYATGRG